MHEGYIRNLIQVLLGRVKQFSGSMFNVVRKLFGPGNTHKRVTTLICVVTVLIVLQSYFWITTDLEQAHIPEVDLAGNWELCLPSNRSIADCRWRRVELPGDLSTAMRSQLHGWMIYRKTFTAPRSCFGPNAACSLFFGEVGDTAEASLNGVTIGRHGDFPPNEVYSKHYPVRFDLSRDLLKPGENELLLTVYSLKNVQAGIRRGPIGIFTATNAFKTTQSSIAYTIFTPLLAFVGLFSIGIVAFLLAFALGSEDAKTHTYIRYCFASSIFLLSISDIPREYLPIGIAGYLHSILRIVFDWAYFEMVREFFDFSPKLKAWVRPVYWFILAVFAATFGWDLFKGHLEMAGPGFDASHLMLRLAFPVMFLPHCMGIYGALRLRNSWHRKPLALVFSCLLFFQVWDTLIFHGILSGHYAVHIYPLFVGIMMGIFIIERSSEERSRTLLEQTKSKQMELIHNQLRDVAHELKAPLASLTMGCKDLSKAPPNSMALQNAARLFPGEIGELQTKIKAILDYSSELAQNIAPIHCNVDLLNLLRELAERLQDSSGLANLCIQVEGDHVTALVDRNKITGVFRNLIANSIYACRGSPYGKICVSVFAPTWSQPWIKITIQDNGPGIPTEIQDKLFQPFATFGKPNGTGLGLTLAKRTIEAHEGTIFWNQEYKNGTEFQVNIPRDR